MSEGENAAMMLKIPGVFDKDQVADCRAIIDAGPWVDGNETSGHQSRMAKQNEQLQQGCDAANRAGQMVLSAISRSPLFVSGALPLKVFPPLFNRYGVGQTFGTHVDNAIRQLRGSDFRIRSDLSCTLFLEEPEDRKSTRLNSSHVSESRMPSSA